MFTSLKSEYKRVKRRLGYLIGFRQRLLAAILLATSSNHADELARVATARGGKWYAATVRNAMARDLASDAAGA
jgi:hypothetical protein